MTDKFVWQPGELQPVTEPTVLILLDQERKEIARVQVGVRTVLDIDLDVMFSVPIKHIIIRRP